jgi:hypothetical protein
MINSDDLNLDFKLVREELTQLKTCQITFLSISITATALILSVSNKFQTTGWVSDQFVSSLIFLTPLVILIPAGIIFFDKALTVSRAVGYIRILESLKMKKISSANYCGFENSLGLWRNYPFTQLKSKLIERVNDKRSKNYILLQSGILKHNGLLPDPKNKSFFREIIDEIPCESIRKSIDLIFLFSSLRYWMIVFYIFTGLSAACIFLGIENYGGVSKIMPELYQFSLSNPSNAFVVIVIIFWVFFFYLLYFVWHLTTGHFSYDYNEEIWRDVLDIDVVD